MWHLFCVLVFLSLLFLFFFCSCSLCIFWMAQLGYLHCVGTSSRCFNSSFSSWELEQTAFALCVRVLIALYLQARLWWLSLCRYWSVWMGFLYTLVVNVPSSWGWPKCPGRAWNHLVSVLLWWTLWLDLQSLCAAGTHLSCLVSKWQMCHPQTFPTIWGVTAVVRALSSKTPYTNWPLQGSQETP